MSDTFVSSIRPRRGGSSGPATASPYDNDYPDGLDLSRRVRLLTDMFPEMAASPDVLLDMATQPMSVDQLATQAGQMFGMQTADKLAQRLSAMDEQTQRGVYDTLTESQKMALRQIGYSRPNSDAENWLDRALGPVDEVAGVVLGPVDDIIGYGAGKALKGLQWSADRVSNTYRTIRMQDEWSQLAAAGGAILGGLAVAAAPLTGGLSTLGYAGLIGLGALGGGAAASFATTSVISNPNDWIRAFRDSWNGERTFRMQARQRAEQLLGDPRLVGLAQDLVLVDDDFDISELLYDLAGRRDTSINSQLVHLEELASTMATPGSPEYQQAYQAMLNTIQDPLFQEAVLTLQHGKISPGRDVARIFGIDPGTGLHNLVSGSIDAAWSMAVDPTLVLGGISRWNKVRRYGVKLHGSATDLADEFARVAQRADVQRYHQMFVDAFNAQDLRTIRTYTPEMERAVMPFQRFLNAASKEEATIDDLHEWFVGSIQLGTAMERATSPLAQGIGTMRGMNGIVLANLRPTSMLYRTIAGNLRAFTGSLTDVALEKKVQQAIDDAVLSGHKIGEFGDESTTIAVPGFSDLFIDPDTGKIVNAWQYNQRHKLAARTGRALGAAGVGRIKPFHKLGDVIQSITTMAPSSNVVALTGDKAIRDVVALTEMGRFMGMPSWARRAMADAIIFSDDVGARWTLAHGFLDNAMTLAGARATRRGSRIVDEFLAKAAHAYGIGERKVINGMEVRVGAFLEEQADAIVMPNLLELHRAAKANLMGEFLGIVDANIIDPAMTKIWKPAVLIRIGFIPRAAGEEMVNFMFRGGFGGLVQEFGARSAGRRIAIENARDAKRLGVRLTQDQKELLALGELAHLPTHIRPLARMLDHWDWTQPIMKKLDQYAEWLQTSIETGLPGFRALHDPLDRTLRRIGDDAQVDLVRNIGRADPRQLGTVVDGVLVESPNLRSKLYSGWRGNLARNTNAILLGNPHSWRRYAIGGVADAKLEAAIAYQGTFARALMDEVSTMSAGPYDPGHDPALEQKRMMLDRDGELVERPTITLKGQPGIYDKKSWEYSQGIHYQAVSKIHDPIGGELAARFISNIAPASIDLDDWNHPVWQAMLAMQGMRNPVLAGTARQFLGKPDPRMFRAYLRDLRSQGYESMADFLGAWLDAGNLDTISATEVVEGIRAFRFDQKQKGLPVPFNSDAELDELDRIVRLDEALAQLSPEERRWAGQWIKTGNADNFERATVAHEQLMELVEEQARIMDEKLTTALMEVDTEMLGHEAYIHMVDEMIADAEARRARAQESYTFWMNEADETEQALHSQFRFEAMAFQEATREVETWEQFRRLAENALADGSTGREVLQAMKQMHLRQLDQWRSLRPQVYTSWAEAEQAMTEAAAMALFNAHNQAAAAKSVRMLGSGVKEGQTRLWLVDPPSGVTMEQIQGLAGSEDDVLAALDLMPNTRDYDTILALAQDRSIIERNRTVVEQWIARPDGIIAVADRQLARELNRIAHMGQPMTINSFRVPEVSGVFGAGLLRGRQTETITTLAQAKNADGDMQPVAWLMDRAYGGYFEQWDEPLEKAWMKAHEMAEVMVAQMRGAMTKYNQQYATAAQRTSRTVDEATGEIIEATEPMVYRFDDVSGERVPVGPDDRIRLGDVLFDAKGKKISNTDPRYVDINDIAFDEGGEVMWSLIGPMIEDFVDNNLGRNLFLPKQSIRLEAGEVIPLTDEVPVWRSSRSDVLEVGDGLPEHVTAPRVVDAVESTWDKFVRTSFDKVIGPAIDALARKPMAFHFFSERYEQAMKMRTALLPPSMLDTITNDVTRVLDRRMHQPLEWDGRILAQPVKREEAAASVRTILVRSGRDTNAEHWDDATALAWLRGHEPEELDRWLSGLEARYGRRFDDDSREIVREVLALRNNEVSELRSVFLSRSPDETVAYIAHQLPPGALETREAFESFEVRMAIRRHKGLSGIDNAGWEAVFNYAQMKKWMRQEAGEFAAIYAINDMLPFVDSHEFKTQFAEIGRGFLPFWYAEENFLKRWARTLLDQGPLSTIRKAQLSYMGLKQAGVIRSDQQGRDYFVYPGSTLLTEAVGKVWPGGVLPVGMVFQAPTDRMLPGLSGERTGQPGFSPLVSVPLALLTQRIPELVPLQRVLVGDFAAQQGALTQLVPTQLQNFWTAFAKGGEASSRFASAQMSAIAMLEANGQGLPDNATPGERDEFLRKVSNHARIILVSQAFMGFVVPGAPQQFAAGEANLSGLGLDDPRGILNQQYQELVQNLGIEEGTKEFLQTYPLANLEHIVTSDEGALALTQGQTYSRSGAPLPATTEAMAFYDRHEEYMKQVPHAGPWLLPTAGTQTPRDQYAYDQQTINGLRLRQTPGEFLDAIKFKEAAGPYFEQRQMMLDRVAEAQKAGRDADAANIRREWEVWATLYKANHPIFAQKLEASNSRQERELVLDEMRRVVRDPDAPKSNQYETLSGMVQVFDYYKLQLSILGTDRSAKGKARTELLKSNFETAMRQMIVGNPVAAAFWSSVIRPESSLD